jgi:hypothetical protein
MLKSSGRWPSLKKSLMSSQTSFFIRPQFLWKNLTSSPSGQEILGVLFGIRHHQSSSL